VAVPALLVVAAATAAGGWTFTVALAAVSAMATAEAMRLFGAAGALAAASVAGAALLVVIAFAEGREALPPALLGAGLIVLVAAIARAPDRRRAGLGAAGVLCLLWVGGGLAHGVLLRESPHGVALVVAVLVGTFVGDTAAHVGGTLVGTRPLAPRISPNKTREGFALGIAFGTAATAVFLAGFHSWIGVGEAVVIGLAVAVAAPLGDLWESALKRDAGVKDSGSVLGPHGGILDRVDAVLFTAPAGFYVALALL